MAILKFPADEVRKLVEHAEAATEHRPPYGEKPSPGLFLVGDQGVYLMSSGLPHFPRGDGSGGSFVVYARGINPNVDSFDSWWAAKQDSFGGDDGSDLLPLEPFRIALAAGMREVQVEVTPTTVGVMVPA